MNKIRWLAIGLVCCLPCTAQAQVESGVISMTMVSWNAWGGVARDAIARLDDVNKDSVKRVNDKGQVTFEAKAGHSIDLKQLHAALKATRLSGRTGSIIHYLEITAAGTVEIAGAELLLHVSGSKEVFVLGADESLKEEIARSLVDLRDALNRGKKISGVTGRVKGWSGPYPKMLASYPPGEMPPPRPVLIVTDFRVK